MPFHRFPRNDKTIGKHKRRLSPDIIVEGQARDCVGHVIVVIVVVIVAAFVDVVFAFALFHFFLLTERQIFSLFCFLFNISKADCFCSALGKANESYVFNRSQARFSLF